MRAAAVETRLDGRRWRNSGWSRTRALGLRPHDPPEAPPEAPPLLRALLEFRVTAAPAELLNSSSMYLELLQLQRLSSPVQGFLQISGLISSL